MIKTRKQRLMEIAKIMGAFNPTVDLGIEIANGSDGQLALFLTGNVEGRSLKFPLPHWRFSKKNGGTIVGPSLPVYYEKHWKYKLKLV